MGRPQQNEVSHNSDGTTVLTLSRRVGGPLYCTIDTADYDTVKGRKWCAMKSARTFYAGLHIHKRKEGISTSIQMHRLFLPDTKEIDHIDGNGLNNRRSNLRPATRALQMHNRKKWSRGGGLASSQYIGVSKDKKNFRARIVVEGKKLHLGMFGTEIEAALAYNEAAKKHFGEFARLNAGILHDEKKRSIAA